MAQHEKYHTQKFKITPPYCTHTLSLQFNDKYLRADNLTGISIQRLSLGQLIVTETVVFSMGFFTVQGVKGGDNGLGIFGAPPILFKSVSEGVWEVGGGGGHPRPHFCRR